MKNKRGQVSGIFMFFIVLGVILIVGLIIGMGAYFFKTTINPTLTELKGIGSIDEGTNMTYITEVSGNHYETISNSFTWLTGVFYMIVILGTLGFGFYMRGAENKRYIMLYFALMILLIIIAILVSNSYENMYTAGDELSDYLKTLSLLSFLVLNSPIIFSIIGFISGIIMFTGGSDETYA